MREYEDLPGETGQRMFYVEERRPARAVFDRKIPDLFVNGQLAGLHEIWRRGVSGRLRQDAERPLRQGQTVHLELMIDGRVLQAADSYVSDIADAQTQGAVIEFTLSRGYLDLETLGRAQERMAIAGMMRAAQARISDVPPTYRELCAEAVHLMRAWRSTLSQIDNAELAPADARALLDEITPQVVDAWRPLVSRANALVAPGVDDPRNLAAMKAFTETIVTPELLDGPLWARTYHKPLGYPGDRVAMEYSYAGTDAGTTLYGRLCHRLGLALMRCVDTRRAFAEEMIREMAGRPGATAPLRVTNIGCGSAREVRNLVQETLPRQLAFSLLDQDRDALEFVHRDTLPSTLREDKPAQVDLIHASFRQLLRSGELVGKLPPQDMVYSLGLIDYLTEARCRALVNSLYGLLAPGGRLLVANLRRGPDSTYWPTEFLVDWRLVWRNEDDMTAIGRDIPEACRRTAVDETGQIVFLIADKPA
ncbi:hypothetical protein CKO28_04800 [Rhodovibrio sodomensis]|uniref:Class I SAM-dependent methyltransferase n=1 Tax=Rhodovibrio sodomensis TaxID=1088 RepID=A0ABS1DA94_9PROT|nr:class I SAM-dependent methyltransferase [Rhodovibrio sodomensis]MBK1667347.1 hypothetical protein [Rhodovibrio sodomensis]